MTDASHPWPLLKQLHQGDIEETALVDKRGEVVARVSAPEAYQGDLRTAVENGELTAQIVSASAAAPALYEALSDLIRSYEALVRTARDRIIDLGGDCDPAPRLIASDPALIEARSALILANTGGTENG